MAYEQIRYDVEDHIATLTLHRPEKLNAFTARMCKEMIDAFDRADADDAVRAIIVTGAGRGFCAGADLGGGRGVFERDAGKRDAGGLLTLRIFECNKPVIAAINGPAVGVGATMTLAMDMRIAAENARFGFVFARRGIVPEAASSWFLPRVVGIAKALEWSLSGRIFDAQEALGGGLVQSLHPKEALPAAARSLAGDIASECAGVSVALTRHMMWRMLGADHPMEAHKLDSQALHHTGRLADANEGVAAFLEKRPAAFSGKVSADMPDFFPWWEARRFE